MQDFSYVIRSLLRNRLFSAASVLTFAVGLGATTAIVTLVDAAWFSWSSAFSQADRLVMLYKSFSSGSGPTTPHDFRDWQRDAKSFDGVAGYMRSGMRLTVDNEPTMVNSVAATSNLLQVLGVRPLLGRFFGVDEEQWGRNSVVVLSYQTWQRRFSADPNVVGRKVIVDQQPAEIIGVAPRGAWFGVGAPALFVPLSFAPGDPRNSRNSHFIFALGRLKPGVTLDGARAELKSLAARIALSYPENTGASAIADPLADVVLGDVKPVLRVLLAAVLLVLVIACANTANLMLVRGAARFREMAVRSALGASPRRLAQQPIAESVVLAMVGGVIGIALAFGLLRVVQGAIPIELPRIADTGIAIDWRIAAVSLAMMLASGLVCGLLPAFQVMRSLRSRNATDVLREGSRGVAGGTRAGYVRAVLVIGQVSVALVLLVTSALFVRSLRQLQERDAGVRPDNVLSVRLMPPSAMALDSAAAVRFFDDAIRHVSAVPGVVMAGVSSNLPLSGGGETKSFYVEGREPATVAEVQSVVGRMESAASLQTIGARLIRGRSFAESDRGSAPRVAIISESVARRFFGDENPLGKRVSLHRPEAFYSADRLPPGGRWPRWTVIGVVSDVNYGNPREEPEAAVYVHYPQGLQVWNWGPRWLVARTTATPASTASAVRSALRVMDATLPLNDIMPLADRMSNSLRAPRFTTALVATFAIVSVLLGVVGLYGVIAYAVSQETRSFGIRIALGASRSRIAKHVLRRGAQLALLGILIGFVLTLVAGRAVKAQLFMISSMDPLSYAIAATSLFALTLLASYLPARRAARVDPLVALRAD
jgi:putative ABC transport system permease protein